MYIITSLITGIIFGIGLILSGMTNPAKVIGFLDLASRWDPSLGLVMGGAILIGLFASRWAAGRKQSLTGAVMRVPTATHIDRRLVMGGLTFGVGWGLAGYCPGPALVSLASGGAKPLVFVAAMVTGMIVFEVLERIPPRSKRTA